MNSNVLIVEDNSGMREALTLFLSGNGFKVSAYDSTEDGIDAVDEHDFDIALIDINLPGKSGFSMIEYIRESNKSMPLIAMTARDGLQDKLNGFELGLTDYIVKPFELKELLARMQVHLRNLQKGSDKSKLVTKNFTLDPAAWKFLMHNKPVALTNIEFRMMHFLMKHNKTVVRLDDLIEYVWGDDPNSITPPVRIHIGNLRKKIGDDELAIIKTIPGIGYRFSDPPNE